LLFPDYIVSAGDTVELVLRTRVLARDGTEFTMNLQTSDIAAEVASGPLQGLAVAAVTADGADVVVDEVFTLVERTLAGSFAVRDNPWDPDQEHAEFMYYLPQADDVTFVIYTLTGEEVHRAEFRSGENGARAGENTVLWDGRSGDGSFVVNGVYVVVVSVGSGLEQATLKLAVMK
jgi:flagellar hook assembly protein FlgD